MLHKLKLYSKNYERMKLNNKPREYRLYDEKRRLINISVQYDLLIFLIKTNFFKTYKKDDIDENRINYTYS